jgi:hypothetical protein
MLPGSEVTVEIDDDALRRTLNVMGDLRSDRHE